MKDIKLSFPYPSTSRHNLSQDISTSLSMGLLIPVRVIKVLPGDSHRITTSFSLISNPLVKPLLQSVNMRYCRFWVPSRIYSLDQRANNENFDPMYAPVRVGRFNSLYFPIVKDADGVTHFYSNFQQSSLFDYLGVANMESNFVSVAEPPTQSSFLKQLGNTTLFNAEPYLGYVDICRNYFGDSSSGMIAWSSGISAGPTVANRLDYVGVVVSPLQGLDTYIDSVQNSRTEIKPYDFTASVPGAFTPFVSHASSLGSRLLNILLPGQFESGVFSRLNFGISHISFCVPFNRPDRLSRLFDTRPLTSQNASVNSNEITIGNLSFLSKLQRYFTRRFFGGSRFTDVMHSVFGQTVPHVDSPVLLDVFDYEIGSELVASTNATTNSNPGVLGGYFRAAGILSTHRGRSSKRYTFNESGYLMDLVYLMPRISRCALYSDFYPVSSVGSSSTVFTMSQGNFTPDFNGIGWQQPAFVSLFRNVGMNAANEPALGSPVSFCCEPSWQQYRTLPDVVSGALNPIRGKVSYLKDFTEVSSSIALNAPLMCFSDRMSGVNIYSTNNRPEFLLSQMYFTDFNDLNRVFGVNTLTYDNIFAVFRYKHQAKRQVSKRFTLTFN